MDGNTKKIQLKITNDRSMHAVRAATLIVICSTVHRHNHLYMSTQSKIQLMDNIKSMQRKTGGAT